MTQIKQKIDYEIIWKKIHTKLDDSEEQQLSAWIAQDKRHQAYFDWIVRYYKGDETLLVSSSSKLGWEDFRKRSGGQKKNVLIYLSGVAALIILAIGLNWFWSESKSIDNQQVIRVASISPGSKKAILITENGNSYELTDINNLDSQLSNARMEIKDGSISYRNVTASDKLKYHTLKIPRGGEYYIVLSDNSKVWLNSESTLKFPVSFSSESREVQLEGEAYFEVAKDRKRPFRVVTGNQTVQVLGTSFNISSYSGKAIFTTLVEGEVEVYKTHEPANRQILSPEYQSTFSRNTGDIEINKVAVSEFIAWKEGSFLFINKPLGEMLNTLSRWYNVEIIYLNNDLKAIPFTGKVKRYEDLNQLLELLEKTHEVTFEVNEDTVWVK